MEVKINKEIRNYTEFMFFGLSMRRVKRLLSCTVLYRIYVQSPRRL